MTLHLPKKKKKRKANISIAALWAKENFRDKAGFLASTCCVPIAGAFIAPLLIPCLFRNFCMSISIPAGRLDSEERLFRIDHFPVVNKKEEMDLSDLRSLFSAAERLAMPEKAARASLPLLKPDLLSHLGECLWRSQPRVLPVE